MVGHSIKKDRQTRKQRKILQHHYNFGPTSKTFTRRYTNVIQMFCVFWDCHLFWKCHFTLNRLEIIFKNILHDKIDKNDTHFF